MLDCRCRGWGNEQKDAASLATRRVKESIN